MYYIFSLNYEQELPTMKCGDLFSSQYYSLHLSTSTCTCMNLLFCKQTQFIIFISAYLPWVVAWLSLRTTDNGWTCARQTGRIIRYSTGVCTWGVEGRRLCCRWSWSKIYRDTRYNISELINHISKQRRRFKLLVQQKVTQNPVIIMCIIRIS